MKRETDPIMRRFNLAILFSGIALVANIVVLICTLIRVFNK